MSRALLRTAALPAALALALGGAMTLTPVAVPAAFAQSAAKAAVDAAKASGVVGEQSDGMLGIVSGGDSAVRSAVAEINAGRAAAYRDAAAKTGTTPAAAGEAAFNMLLSRMPSGQYYRPVGGGWTRK